MRLEPGAFLACIDAAGRWYSYKTTVGVWVYLETVATDCDFKWDFGRENCALLGHEKSSAPEPWREGR